MKNLPDKKQLDIMWTVATSGALETGTGHLHRCPFWFILTSVQTN